MPTTINELSRVFNLNHFKMVHWGFPPGTEEVGIYIISLSPDPEKNIGTLEKCPVDVEIINEWIYKVGGFELDGLKTFDAQSVTRRMSEFWLPDENILYIGNAPKRSNNKGIGNRVREFYKTEYGEAKPHAGGHWLKSLKNLNELYVYYAETYDSGNIEIEMLEFFCDNVSDETLEILMDKKLPLPFANLELTKGKRKNHGLYKMKKC